jgi:hypothetical protein
VQDAHEDFTGLGALRGLGSKADFAGDDQRAQLPLGAREPRVTSSSGMARRPRPQ